MELKKITSRVFYYPHQPETDRPMLAYLNGDKIALAIDAEIQQTMLMNFINP